MDAYQLSHLKNGMKAILVPSLEAMTATVTVLVHVGSRDETPEMSGAAHFVEHMVFKGVKTLPGPLDITRLLDECGASFNAMTSKEYTTYYIEIEADRLKLAIDTLHQMVACPLFQEVEVEKERRVIIEEMIGERDDPHRLAHAILDADVFGRNPLARTIVGTEESLAGIDRAGLVDFHEKHYRPDRMVVAVSGKFEPATTTKWLERTFGTIQHDRKNPPCSGVSYFCDRRLDGPKLVLVKKDMEQTYVAVGWPGYAHEHPLEKAADALNIILGGSFSSRLNEIVRERESLAYMIGSDHGQYIGAGMFTTFTNTSPDSTAEAFRLMREVTEDLRLNGPTEDEVLRAKRHLRGITILAYNGLDQRTHWYAMQALLLSEIDDIEVSLAKIEAISADDVCSVASELLDPKQMTVVAVGRKPTLAAVKAIFEAEKKGTR